MMLYLRDLDTNVVRAWQEIFGDDPEVNIESTTILILTADAIVSPANSRGWMDGGIDAKYLEHFGTDLQVRLQEEIAMRYPDKTHDHWHNTDNYELPIGEAIAIPTLDDKIPWMISAPTMAYPMPVPASPNAFLAFRAALRVARTRGFKTIACPGLATLTGRMDPLVCATQMFTAWQLEKGTW